MTKSVRSEIIIIPEKFSDPKPQFRIIPLIFYLNEVSTRDVMVANRISALEGYRTNLSKVEGKAREGNLDLL